MHGDHHQSHVSDLLARVDRAHRKQRGEYCADCDDTGRIEGRLCHCDIGRALAMEGEE